MKKIALLLLIHISFTIKAQTKNDFIEVAQYSPFFLCIKVLPDYCKNEMPNMPENEKQYCISAMKDDVDYSSIIEREKENAIEFIYKSKCGIVIHFKENKIWAVQYMFTTEEQASIFMSHFRYLNHMDIKDESNRYSNREGIKVLLRNKNEKNVVVEVHLQ